MHTPSLPPHPIQAVLKSKTAHHTQKPQRAIPSRVTFFYQYRDKQGKYHKLASVSKTVLVQILPPKPLDKRKPKQLK